MENSTIDEQLAKARAAEVERVKDVQFFAGYTALCVGCALVVPEPLDFIKIMIEVAGVPIGAAGGAGAFLRARSASAKVASLETAAATLASRARTSGDHASEEGSSVP